MAERTVVTTRQLSETGDWSGFWHVGVYDGENLVEEHRVKATTKAQADIAARAIIAESKSVTTSATSNESDESEEEETDESEEEETDESEEEETDENTEEAETQLTGVPADQITIPAPRKRR